MSEIAIVVVTHNSATHIGACLDAALPSGAELVVVDNASEDRTREEVAARGVRLIANDRNPGFAAAVNQGIRETAADYILLLNPDALLTGGLDALRACCERPGVAGAGGKLVDDRGRPQAGFMFRRFPSATALIFEALALNRAWPRNPVNRKFRCLDCDYEREQPVDQPAGAFLMIRRDVWQTLGGFDESFQPLWFEDVDFARRAVNHNYRMIYTPHAVAKHTGGHSIVSLPLEMRTVYWYGNLFRYVSRHFTPSQVRSVSLAVVTGSAMRMVAGSFSERSFKPIGAYARVVGLASRYLVSPRQG